MAFCLKGFCVMEEETIITNMPDIEPPFSLRDMDEETAAILVDDKIATGG